MSIAAISFERTWITRHGPPASVGGDHEFDKTRFKYLLQIHNIKWEPRPARRHNQVGIAERKSRVIKDIMERLSIADPYMTTITLAARCAFLSNVVAGSRIASSFEMARGYTSGICCLRSKVLDDKLVKEHCSDCFNRTSMKRFESPCSAPVEGSCSLTKTISGVR